MTSETPSETPADMKVGAPVFTSDGKQLGHVKDVELEEFQIDVPRARDYWLQRTIVHSFSDERVELLVTDADLEAYKMEKPNDPDGYHQLNPNLESQSIRDKSLWRQG